MLCKQCGKNVDDDARFCKHCGVDLARQWEEYWQEQAQPVGSKYKKPAAELNARLPQAAAEEVSPVEKLPTPRTHPAAAGPLQTDDDDDDLEPTPVHYQLPIRKVRVTSGHVTRKPEQKKQAIGTIIGESFARILLGFIVFGLIVSLILVGAWWMSPTQRLSRLIHEDNTKGAIDLYQANFLNQQEGFENEAMTAYLLQKTDQIRADFIAGQLNDADTRQHLDLIESAGLPAIKTTVQETRTFLAQVVQSREDFNDGKNAAAELDYITAMTAFSKIPEGDPLYSQAQGSLNEARTQFILVELNLAKDKADKQDYAGAIQILQKALLTLPGAQELQSQLDTYQATFETQQLEELLNIAAETAKQDPVAAIDFLKQSKAEWPDEEKIDQAIEEYRQQDIEALLSQAEDMVKNQRYDDAEKLLNEGIGRNPGVDSLVLKIDWVDKQRPVKLSDFNFRNLSNFQRVADVIRDVDGNEYKRNTYTISGGFFPFHLGSAEVAPEGAYKELRGTLAVADNSSNNSTRLQILGDGAVLYTSPVLSRDSVPIQLNVKVSQTKKLQFVTLQSSELGGHVIVILSDFKFYR